MVMVRTVVAAGECSEARLTISCVFVGVFAFSDLVDQAACNRGVGTTGGIPRTARLLLLLLLLVHHSGPIGAARLCGNWSRVECSDFDFHFRNFGGKQVW